MRMLLVAPERTGVSWSSEVELLGAVLHAVPLTGFVSGERLTRATSGERFTILHVVADGADEGVALSDGLLVKERLAQLARHVRADLVFLNACRSAALGQYLACQGVPAVICYTVPVLDADALRMASYFYEELVALNLDYRRAFEKVSPCDGSLAWFAGAGYIDKAVEPLVTMVGFLQQEMVTMRRTMVRGLVAMGVLFYDIDTWAYSATSRPPEVQQCIVHLLRNWLEFVAWKEYNAVIGVLKHSERAESAEGAGERRAELAASEWGQQGATTAPRWRRPRTQVIPFRAYPQAVRHDACAGERPNAPAQAQAAPRPFSP